MRLTSLFLDEHYIRALDELIKAGFYPNRSEAIRFAVRDLLNLHFGSGWGYKFAEKKM